MSTDILPARPRWKRWAVVVAVPLLILLIAFAAFWAMFFHYVPPGHMLVVISKSGDPLPEGEVLAEPGQKGIQKHVLGEGWHFVWPILYTTERKPIVVIKPGEVGIVTALGGKVSQTGSELAHGDDERGIRRSVLLPGSYRLNPYGYRVEVAKMVTVEPGFVGVKRRLLGQEARGGGDGVLRFAEAPGEKGILNEVLQPGIYPINTREYEIIACEVGIYQTTYSYAPNPAQNTALTFQAQDSYTISMDCTVEWELEPVHWPMWLTRFRNRETIEKQVIRLHAEQIAQVSGNRFGAQDFLDGDKRERFQANFRDELKRMCARDKVVIKNAFIRNIIIPDTFLEQKRLERLAVETKLTKEALALTEQTKAGVAEAQQTVELKVAEVKADTARQVALVERDTENVTVLTEAEVEKIKADYGLKIAELETKRKVILGEAEAEAKRLKEQARAGLYEMKMKVFGRDGEAFLRYTLAQQLSPTMKLRLFQSGPGTLWTNMGKTDMTFMMPLGGEVKVPAESGPKEKKDKP